MRGGFYCCVPKTVFGRELNQYEVFDERAMDHRLGALLVVGRVLCDSQDQDKVLDLTDGEKRLSELY